MHSTGIGAVKDEAEAVNWYRKAADRGHAGAQSSLGLIYWNGTGVPKDGAEAYKWYLLASAQGNEIAKDNIPNLKRRLTAEQRSAGRKLAREFKPREQTPAGDSLSK